MGTCSNCERVLETDEYNRGESGVLCDDSFSDDKAAAARSSETERKSYKWVKKSQAPETLEESTMPQEWQSRFNSYYQLDRELVQTGHMKVLALLTILPLLISFGAPTNIQTTLWGIGGFFGLLLFVSWIVQFDIIATRKRLLAGNYRVLTGEVTLRMVIIGDEKRAHPWLEESCGNSFPCSSMVKDEELRIWTNEHIDCTVVEDKPGRYMLVGFYPITRN